MHPMISCLAAVLLLLHVGIVPAADATPGTFVYAGCSPSRYAPNTAFESNLNSLLASMASAASSGATYNSFTSGAGGSGAGREAAVAAAVDTGVGPAPASSAAAYGLYQCRGDLRPGECVACVRDTVARVGAVCANAYAGSLQSDGCYVRYGARNDFVGRADTSAVAYRRCSAGTSGDAGFLSARGAVLAELQQTATAASSGGGYKVSSSGPVHGVAECLGDTPASQCAACVSQAVAQLGGACGAALAADVYLVQCSVRYWANGNYYRSSQENSGDDVGRTVAIIIGILAGLALLVVFISFLRKACN
ncbi:Cysteine-rich repeat secretory protein 15 [Dichanthelium oligosanthes]|uniref:Cysteine-rich repeat secretory protein 15 n=1 Tax=Dichanthelium oligosanthes TaxID=888268 RepID=A0A1E5WB01_9POAL|nr:Cysteine-rich repeat secretory protein 15 [Dichanthelium oligosanthes]